jgi:hypothetical protein
VDRQNVVFLFEVDNRLLDNDQVTAVLREHHLEREVGRERQDRYWMIVEQLGAEPVRWARCLRAIVRFSIFYVSHSSATSITFQV